MWKYFSFFKGYNLLYNLRRTVQINNSLVDAHLKTIPSFWTFTTRSLTCCDTEDLCWHSNRTLHTKILFLCSINQISTNCKEKEKQIYIVQNVWPIASTLFWIHYILELCVSCIWLSYENTLCNWIQFHPLSF